jgi:alkylation response protein AidB-like acyl-CoA dehydrogenase
MTSAETAASMWLEKARALETVVTKYSDDGERDRRLPGPVLQAIRDAGFLSMMRPRSLGGHQLDIESSLLVFEEIARQDGSVGWNAMAITSRKTQRARSSASGTPSWSATSRRAAPRWWWKVDIKSAAAGDSGAAAWTPTG